MTVDTFVADLARALCRVNLNCPTGSPDAVWALQLGDSAACFERGLSYVTVSNADTIASIRAGRVRLNGAVARRCLDQLATSCLRTNSGLDALCPEMLSGTIAAGAGCWTNVECAIGLYCDHGQTSPRSCPGTCRPRLTMGANCTDPSQCPVSSGHVPICNGTCHDGTLGPDAAEGAPCGSIVVAAHTISLVSCARGLYCPLDGGGAGTCRPILAEGSPCTSRDACAAGLACIESAGTTTTTCRRIEIVDQVGAACRVTGDLAICNSLLNLSCTAGGLCESDGDGTRGSRCTSNRETACQSGLYCDIATTTCQPRLAAGAACTTDIDCLSYSCSEEMPRRCLERVCY